MYYPTPGLWCDYEPCGSHPSGPFAEEKKQEETIAAAVDCQKKSKTQEFEFNITTPDLSIPNHVVIFHLHAVFFPQICIFNISSVALTTYKRV